MNKKTFNIFSIIWLIINIPTPLFGVTVLQGIVSTIFNIHSDVTTSLYCFILAIIVLMVAFLFGQETIDGKRTRYIFPLIVSIIVSLISGFILMSYLN